LTRIHIRPSTTCHRCCREEETTSHLFFDCDYAKSTWRASGLPSNFLTSTTSSLNDKIRVILHMALSPRTSQFHQLPLWILWRIWKSKNVLYFHRRHIPWEITLRLAQTDAHEYTEANTVAQINTRSRGVREEDNHDKWRRPERVWIKCNFDGSFVNGNVKSKAGWVVRDSNGSYLLAGQAIGRKVDNALESEIQAIIISMHHCWSHGYKRVCFEGDNKMLFDLINGSKVHFGVHNWIRNIHWWLRKFESIYFNWIRRHHNTPADILAKAPLQNQSLFLNHFWVPNVITYALHCDYTADL